MKRFFSLFLLLMAFSVQAAGIVDYQFSDTSVVPAFKKDTLLYSKVFNLVDYEVTAINVMANDTAAAGLADDSIAFEYGYRLGWIVYNASNAIDTGWGKETMVDTFTTLVAGKIQAAGAKFTTAADGSQVEVLGLVDIASVSGYAWQAHQVKPRWAPLIQCYAQGIAGNKEGSFVKLRFQLTRRPYQKVTESR